MSSDDRYGLLGTKKQAWSRNRKLGYCEQVQMSFPGITWFSPNPIVVMSRLKWLTGLNGYSNGDEAESAIIMSRVNVRNDP